MLHSTVVASISILAWIADFVVSDTTQVSGDGKKNIHGWHDIAATCPEV